MFNAAAADSLALRTKREKLRKPHFTLLTAPKSNSLFPSNIQGNREGGVTMCGIFAYLNYKISRERRYIIEVLFNGLRSLEYRGYDSAGISIDSSFDAKQQDQTRVSSSSAVSIPPLVFRQEGNIDSLVKSVYEGNFLSFCTRMRSWVYWIWFAMLLCFLLLCCF